MEVSPARTDVLPCLEQAEQLAERAYRAGALSYLEWAQLQAEATATRHEELQAAIEGHRALIEIQRLTGESFIAPGASSRAEDSRELRILCVEPCLPRPAGPRFSRLALGSCGRGA